MTEGLYIREDLDLNGSASLCPCSSRFASGRPVDVKYDFLRKRVPLINMILRRTYLGLLRVPHNKAYS